MEIDLKDLGIDEILEIIYWVRMNNKNLGNKLDTQVYNSLKLQLPNFTQESYKVTYNGIVNKIKASQ